MMLRVAYINNEVPFVKPKKLTPKEAIHAAAIETLALAKHQDIEKAKLMFGAEKKELEELQLKLDKKRR